MTGVYGLEHIQRFGMTSSRGDAKRIRGKRTQVIFSEGAFEGLERLLIALARS